MPQKHVIHLIVIPPLHLPIPMKEESGNHLQSAFHPIVSPTPPLKKMMKAESTWIINDSPYKQTKNVRLNISMPIPRLLPFKISLPDQSQRKRMRKGLMMMMNQFVCLLFVFLLLNLLRSSYLVMGQRREIKYLYLHGISSLYIDHNYYYAFNLYIHP
jgi:hypothetical protein